MDWWSVVVYHLQKISGKSSWKVNGTRLFGTSQRKISGSNGTSEKVVLFFTDGIFQTEIRVPFLQSCSKPSLIPVSGLHGRFPVNGTDFYKW